MSLTWIEVCTVDAIDEEDVIGFDHVERSFAIYRSAENTFHATDGFCTHGKVHLADGLVMGKWIECPKHNGRFEFSTGKAVRKPACLDLATYPVKIADGKIYLGLT